MKKRFLAVVLTLALCMGLAIPALAADAPHDVDPYAYNATKYGDKLVSDSKITINGVIGVEESAPAQFDDSVIFDVVVGGGYTLDMSYPAGRDRYYNTYVDMALLNGEPAEDPAAGRLQELAGWFDTTKPQKQYVLTCTEDMVSTEGAEKLYHFWLDWGDSPASAEHTETEGNVNFWLRVHPAPADKPEETTKPEETDKPDPVTPAFTDVKAGEYYEAAVKWAVAHEPVITNGTSDTTFEPGITCTQVQILTFLYRAAGEPESETELPVDIEGKNVDYAKGALCWAAEKGMIDETFDVAADCTRATAVSYIWQAFDKPEADKSEFKDVDAEAAYAAAVDWAVANGVTNGTDMEAGEFSPDDTCTRGQIVTFLHRAYVEEARLNAEK